MKDVRKSLLGALSLCVIIAAIAGFIIVFRANTTAAWVRLVLDILLVGVIHFVVRDFVAPPRATATQITDALRELARGHYHKRLDAESFGDLTEAAHAFNELAGVMSDRLDPHVGVVRYRPKQNRDEADVNHSYHPELGSVRPIDVSKEQAPMSENEAGPEKNAEDVAKSKPEASAEQETAPPEQHSNVEAEGSDDLQDQSEDTSEQQTDSGSETSQSEESADSSDTGEQTEASDEAETRLAEDADDNTETDHGSEDGDTQESAKGASSESDGVDASNEAANEETPPQEETAAEESASEDTNKSQEKTLEPESSQAAMSPLPSDEEMEHLHAKYNAIRLQFDLPQVEFNDLVPVLMETAKTLLEQHQCRAIRFEVQPQDGDVALLPKLIR